MSMFFEYIRVILINYLFTYLLTPWCRVLLAKLTGLQLVKKFPAFHGTRRFITALTSVRHLSLSWASPIQSVYPHPTSWRSILILSTNLPLGLSVPITAWFCLYEIYFNISFLSSLISTKWFLAFQFCFWKCMYNPACLLFSSPVALRFILSIIIGFKKKKEGEQDFLVI